MDVKELESQKSLHGTDLCLAIESFHQIPMKKEALSAIYSCLKPGGALVIADTFNKHQIEGFKEMAEDEKFQVEQEQIVSLNIKHALSLDR